jgi:antitoxin (DNA-binding transcriptional repressor) of toxin-antitoxin stability system
MKPHDRRPRTVKIAELKNRLSYYLRRVRRGESILVCDRDQVIARIERVPAHVAVEANEADWVDRLEHRGIIRRARGRPMRQWLARRPAVKADVVAALLRERDEGPGGSGTGRRSCRS